MPNVFVLKFTLQRNFSWINSKCATVDIFKFKRLAQCAGKILEAQSFLCQRAPACLRQRAEKLLRNKSFPQINEKCVYKKEVGSRLAALLLILFPGYLFFSPFSEELPHDIFISAEKAYAFWLWNILCFLLFSTLLVSP